MTADDVAALNLGIALIDDFAVIAVESAFEWINQNTTLYFDVNNPPKTVPASVKLFLIKYLDIMSTTGGVSSESIEGLSQSFDTTDKADLLSQFGWNLLGGYMKSEANAVQAVKRWL